jgi:enolase-phosphatase E1
MIHFAGKGILLDLEGTTSSMRFVPDVLMPYARRHLLVFLRYLWNDPAMPRIREELARWAGADSFEAWTGGMGMPPESRLTQMRHTLLKLMDQDAKVGPLQEIEALIWREGYRKGTLRSHVYDDAWQKIKQWHKAGLDVRVFSTGSAEAQRLFFANVDTPSETSFDLSEHLTGFFDMTTGPKREAESYRKIARAFDLRPSEILFVSDTPAELDAARSAGLATACVRRPENPAPENPGDHPQIVSFHEIEVRPTILYSE